VCLNGRLRNQLLLSYDGTSPAACSCVEPVELTENSENTSLICSPQPPGATFARRISFRPPLLRPARATRHLPSAIAPSIGVAPRMYATAVAALLGPQLRGFHNGNETSVRIAVVGLSKMLLLLLWNLPFVRSSPIARQSFGILDDDDGAAPSDDPSTWVYLGTAVALVLLGGAFAGLTIAYVVGGLRLASNSLTTVQIDGTGRDISAGNRHIWRRFGTTECKESAPPLEEGQALGACNTAPGQCHHERDSSHRSRPLSWWRLASCSQ
jgi:hypothetical protein